MNHSWLKTKLVDLSRGKIRLAQVYGDYSKTKTVVSSCQMTHVQLETEKPVLPTGGLAIWRTVLTLN